MKRGTMVSKREKAEKGRERADKKGKSEENTRGEEKVKRYQA